VAGPASGWCFPLGSSILLVEDDPSLREIIATALTARGYEVDVAGDGRTALERAAIKEPDLVILDLGLPDIDGVEVCRELRRWLFSPILVLSADGDNERKVAALDEGADDYVTKPFSMSELLARIRVGLRHRVAIASVMADTRELTVGDLVLDVAAHSATAGSRDLLLSPKEFAILKCLASQPGRLMTLRTLTEAVWGADKAGSPGALRVHIVNLRKKIGTGPDRPTIVTQPAVGYRILLASPPD
jgi:two-component system KDP operon response regulator KdpE